MHSHLLDFVESNNVLLDNQHQVFARSALLILNFYQQYAIFLLHLNETKASHLVILDFTRAFDQVLQERLLMKLHYYEIAGPMNNWLRSFLTHRTQQTVCDCVSSPPEQAISGVPQGKVLKDRFCFYIMLMIYRLGLNVKPDYLLMTALFIYPLPLLQIENFNLT